MTYGPLPISIENPTTVANLEIYLHFFRKIGKSEIRLDGAMRLELLHKIL